MITESCPIEVTLSMISGKWKLIIIKELLACENIRFGELLRVIPDISQKVLTSQLRELEEDGLVLRIDYNENPRRVEYSLTKLGLSMVSIMKEIRNWGLFHLLNNEKKPVHCLECKQCQPSSKIC